MTTKQPSKAWSAILRIVTNLSDHRDYHSHRLAALEDRLAKIDAGEGSASARRTALAALRLARRAEGRPVDVDIRLPDEDR